MVVGLGNPGPEYAQTRHNAGFMVVDALADAYTIALNRQKYEAVFGRGNIENIPALLVKPMAYMNRSGPPIQRLSHYHRILHENLLVVHDDIDLDIGRLKIKEKGGDAGHKGIRSLIEALGSGDFARVRVGIGRENRDSTVTNHVLGRFNTEERAIIDRIVAKARDAVITILCKGTAEGMNRFNTTRIII